MENQFFIQKGSFCFIIPFFTENSSICNKYFKNLKNKTENINKNDNNRTERKRIIENAKADFINNIKTNYFEDIRPNFHSDHIPPSCPEKNNNSKYNGRLLCKCISSAAKFHDDISQQRNTSQFFLDSFNAKYNYNNLECLFKFNTILYLIHDDNEKAAYLLIEINMDDINKFNIISKDSSSNIHIKSEQIIFIKHLFYKGKMKIEIERLTNNKETKQCSLQEWVNNYLKELCNALKLKPKRDVPEYVFNNAFGYSFIELKEICDEKHNVIDIDFNDVERNFLNRYSQQAYGLLLSDEGWDKTPIQIIKEKLHDYWTTRNFLCTFFLQHNALLFNLKSTARGFEYTDYSKKWFSHYQDNKYKDYVSSYPCLTGIDSLSIFPFLKAIYKEINIERFEKEYNKYKIGKIRKKLKLLEEILNKSSLNLGEITSMENCIYKQFGIIDKTKRIKEFYEQHVDKLNFKHNLFNNILIAFLTLMTIIIGLLQLILA